jgi:Na+/H+ antiporter NhaC
LIINLGNNAIEAIAALTSQQRVEDQASNEDTNISVVGKVTFATANQTMTMTMTMTQANKLQIEGASIG